MGVRTAQRVRRHSKDPWSIHFALPRPANAALRPGGAAGGPQRLSRASVVARERRRLEKRRDLVDQNVRLPREWADALNPDSPFALNPHMAWLEWAGKSRWHDELRWMKWASATPSGCLLKAYSEDGLNQLRQAVLKVQPVMKHFGIFVPAFYQNNGWRWTGGCSYLEEFDGIVIPQVIVLSTKVSSPHELTWALLHECAHHGLDIHPVPQKRNVSRLDFQKSLHSERFARRFGEILAFYLENQARPLEALTLRRMARNDDYAPPIDPTGKGWWKP